MRLDLGDATADFDAARSVMKIAGSLRLPSMSEYQKVRAFLDQAAGQAGARLVIDLRELRFLNSAGITTLSMFVLARKHEGRLHLRIEGSRAAAWQEKSLGNFHKLWSDVDVAVE